MSTDSAETIADRYTVLECIGEGGMGTVYLARDKQLDRVVAIKLLRTQMTDDAAMRFQKEAKVIAKLKHGAILTALDFGVSESGQPYLVLDYLEGQTLDKILKRSGGALEISAALEVAVRVCEGLAYAHGAGVIHRDIKPSNIYLVGSQPTSEAVRILDFGLVRLKSEEQHMTTAGAIMGSPTYMSPEQARGEDVDERSDIYSTGCVLFEMLTGSPPLTSDTAMVTLALKNARDAPLISQKLPECEFPPGLEEIVARCLSRRPADRYSSIAALGADLNGSIEKYSELFALDHCEPAAVVATAVGGSSGSLSSVHKFAFGALVVSLLVIGILAIWANCWNSEPVPAKPKSIDPCQISLIPLDDAVGRFYFFDDTCVFRCSPNQEQVAQGVDEMVKKNCHQCIFDTVVGPLSADVFVALKRTNLTSVQISHGTLDARAIEALSDIRTLKSLRLNDVTFKGTLIRNPEKLSMMKDISISAIKLGPADLDAIKKLPSVTYIDLVGCDGVSPEFIRSLKNKRKLDSFCFGSEDTGSEHIEAISELRQLVRLQIAHLKNAIATEAIEQASALPKLHVLIINDCELSSDAFREIVNNKSLTLLKFDRAKEIVRADLLKLVNLQHLTELEFDHVPFSNPRDILAVINIRTLESLRLYDMDELPVDVIAELKQGLKHVEVAD